LFNKNAIDGEVDAINEEYKMYLKCNSTCYLQSLCNECNAGNLLNRFRWGSKESLTKENPQ
jgi:secreted Zn-dependent insulinase-like peptidase